MSTKPAVKPVAKSKLASSAPPAAKASKPMPAKPALNGRGGKAAPKASVSPAETSPAIAPKKPPVTTPLKVASQPAVAASKEKPKTPKIKMERDSFTMPKEEYAQIATLKKRLEATGKPVKKSELLRAGLRLLSAMDDAKLRAALAAIPVIKTGRPKK